MIRIVLLGAFALCACYGGDEDADEGRTTESDRVFQPFAFDTLWSLGEQADSSFGLLWSPRGRVSCSKFESWMSTLRATRSSSTT